MTDKAGAAPARIPGLDGIRALSISMVLVAHAASTRFLELSESTRQYVNLGHLGVRVFFVISGFLITSLLLAERQKYGSVSLLQFYFRRTFRIFPAFYAFVAVMVVAEAIGWISLHHGDVWHAITYTTNYHHDRAWAFGHLWSLAVEEQFYLLWPALFLLFGVRGAIGIAAAYVVVAPVVRVLTWHYMPEHRAGIGESFQTVADAIATGCVLAYIRPWLDKNPRFVSMQSRGVTVIVLVAVIYALNFKRASISFSYPVGETLINVCIALFIDWCVRNPTGRLGTFLNWRPMVFVGLLSYSLYLWQQPFLNASSDALATSFPVNLALVFVAALASYYLVESPFLRWRSYIDKRWMPRRHRSKHPAESS